MLLTLKDKIKKCHGDNLLMELLFQFSFSYFSNYYITLNLVVACNVGNI